MFIGYTANSKPSLHWTMSKLLISVIALIGALLAAAAIELPVAKVTLHVINEEGSNLSGVDAGVTFLNPVHKPGVWGSSDSFSRPGKTDNNGSFTVEERAGFEIHYGASSANYYKSTGRFDFNTEKAGRYQPWNPTFDIILKKIIHPIPMYARREEIEMPTLGAPAGFDLAEGDWVAPNGHGKVSDLVFKVDKRVRSFHDFGSELLLTFSNNGDGIQAMPPDKTGGSELRSPRTGPELGYSSLLSLLQGNSKEHGEYGTKGDHQDYFIRVRTVMDSRGEVASALYGKIYNGIEYFPVSYKTAKLRFTYYLNPTPNDRNVEFDPKRNLFTNLKDDERVTAP
jgi:hypothetical protein